MTRRLQSLRPALLVSCLAVATARAAPPANGWTLRWSDEFSGTSLDTSKWSHFTGNYRNAFMGGAAPDVTVGGGNLTILTWTNPSSGVTHTGWIGTQGKFDGVYGYWEARIRFNDSSGVWSAFWLQPDTINTSVSPPDPATYGAEIDIVEHRAIDDSGTNISNKAYEALHWNSYGAGAVSAGPGLVNNPTGTPLQGNWHNYGLKWTPEGYTFYIDGIQVGSSTQGISMRGQWIYLSSIVGGTPYETWAGPKVSYGDAATSTTKMEVDYVRYYRPAETLLDADLEGRKQPWSGSNSNWVSGANGTVASRGTTGASLVATSAAATLAQTVYGLLPDTDYVLTGWARGAVDLAVNSHGGSEVAEAVASATFAKATVPFTTGPASRSANVVARAAAGSGTSYADDFLLRRGATVNNGSLERGDDTAWNLYGGAAVSRSGTIYSGLYAVNFPATTSFAGAEQEVVALAPNTTYRFSGWTRNAGGAVNFGVKNYGGPQVLSGVSGAGYARGSVDFTTGAANTTATVFAYRGASTGTADADAFFLCQPLVAPWASQDVSTTGLAGTAGRLGDRFVVQAAGADIWTTSDKFHFISQQLAGDTRLTARIVSLDNTNPAAKTGVMMRDTTGTGNLGSGAKSITLDWTPAMTLELIVRGATGGSSVAAATVGGIAEPPWVRLERRNDTFTATYSTDGINWTAIGAPQVLTMNPLVNVGIATCSHDPAVFTEAVLDQVTAVPVPPLVAVTAPSGGPLTIAGAPANLRLSATATDDPSHGAITTAWSVSSGPGGAVFANAAATTTSILLPQTGTYVLRLTATNAIGGVAAGDLTVIVNPAPDSALAAWYKLNQTGGTLALDSSGNGAHAFFSGGATWTAGILGNAVSLGAAAQQYATLPSGIAAGASAFTFAAWVKPAAIATWARVFDFGTGTTNYMFLAPRSGGGALRFAITTAGGAGEQQINGPAPLAAGVWQHVAVTLAGTTGILYLDGKEAGRNAAMTLTPASLGSTTLNYLGKSQFADPYFDGLLDDVRIYRRACPPSEIAGLANANVAPTVAAGPAPAALNGVAATLSGSALSETGGTPGLAWSEISGPGTATFANPSAAITGVTFDQPGTYVLRLTATAPNAEVFSQTTVTVAPNPDVFADWQALHWPGETDPAIVGATADPNGNGLANVLEFALGLDPAAGETLALPTANWAEDGGTEYLAVTARRPVGRLGIGWSSEVSGDLANWTAGVQTGPPVNLGDGTESVTYRDTEPRGSAPRFIRLKVGRP